MKPFIHYDSLVRIKGKIHYFAEITTNAGTHGIYVNKEKVDNKEIKTRN